MGGKSSKPKSSKSKTAPKKIAPANQPPSSLPVAFVSVSAGCGLTRLIARMGLSRWWPDNEFYLSNYQVPGTGLLLRLDHFCSHTRLCHGVAVKLYDVVGRYARATLDDICDEPRQGVFVLFDLLGDYNASRVFEDVMSWVKDLEECAPSCAIVLCGTKLDLLDADPARRAITPEHLAEMAEGTKRPVFETSALTGEGAEEALAAMVDLMLTARHDSCRLSCWAVLQLARRRSRVICGNNRDVLRLISRIIWASRCSPSWENDKQ